MKKLFSLFLAVFLIFFGNFSNFFAGGEDKEVVLSDGTKLIYVSTEKILEVYKQFAKKRNELLAKRPSILQNVLAKGCGVSLGALGWFLSSKLENSCPKIALCGKFISVISGLGIFFFTDVIDYKLGRDYCGIDDRNGGFKQWGPDVGNHEGYGIASIYAELGGWYEESQRQRWDAEKVNSGIVIILRPRSKWNPPINTPTVHSGIYPQCEMEEHGQSAGYLYALKVSIENGV